MKIKKFTSLLFILMLLGCSSINTPSEPAVVHPTAENTKILSSPTPSPTSAPAIIPTATKRVEADRPEGCIELTPAKLNLSALDGLLLIKGGFLDPQSGQKIRIVDESQNLGVIGQASPNKEHMLMSITQSDATYYYALKSPGNDTVTKVNIPIKDDWVFSWWSDNEHIIFYTLEPEEYLNSWNPFTGEVKKVKLEVPNAINETFSLGRYLVYAYIDPTLEKVFYGSTDGKLVLWNLETKKEIASLPLPEKAKESSAELVVVAQNWLPEQKKLITSWPLWYVDMKPPANELYSFDTEGKINQLTSLNQKYPFANAENPNWSPDGRRAGFWLRIGADTSDPLTLHQWLAVLDIETKEIALYCLANGIPEQKASDIIWSPNSQQLIVDIESPDEKSTSILVDRLHQTQSAFDFPVREWLVR